MHTNYYFETYVKIYLMYAFKILFVCMCTIEYDHIEDAYIHVFVHIGRLFELIF